eukprot:6206071-Pleurochrysis_carterae.AAC.5
MQGRIVRATATPCTPASGTQRPRRGSAAFWTVTRGTHAADTYNTEIAAGSKVAGRTLLRSLVSV